MVTFRLSSGRARKRLPPAVGVRATCSRPGWEAATIRHARDELLAAGLADDAEIDAHLAAIHAGELDLTLAPLISAWGLRPADHPAD
jgi:hypothetical protein